MSSKPLKRLSRLKLTRNLTSKSGMAAKRDGARSRTFSKIDVFEVNVKEVGAGVRRGGSEMEERRKRKEKDGEIMK